MVEAMRTKRRGAMRATRAAHAAAMSAAPMDGAPEYRLDRTGTNTGTAYSAMNQLMPIRIARRSSSASGVLGGAANQNNADTATANVAPRSTYSATFFSTGRGSNVRR